MNLFALPNPVGTPQEVPEVIAHIDDLVTTWEENKAQKLPSKFQNAVSFILHGVDHLIKLVDDVIPKGTDKKATVLAAIALLYDKIVYPSLPIWLKPFAAGIKTFTLDVIVGLLVDFIVRKYREAEWAKENPIPETAPIVAPEAPITPAV